MPVQEITRLNETTELINAEAPAPLGAQEERAAMECARAQVLADYEALRGFKPDDGVVVEQPGNPAPDPHVDGRDSWTKAVGNIETASGMRYDFRNPDPDTVVLEDIAHALSNVCRFAGQIRRFNSVAEHSVLASRIVEARGGSALERRAALLHDGHEAYIWDAPSPLKPLLGDVFKELADIADDVIVEKFLSSRVYPVTREIFKAAAVKAADYTALVVEARGLLPVGPSDDEWEPLPKGVHWDGGLTPYEAKTLFLKRAGEVGL